MPIPYTRILPLHLTLDLILTLLTILQFQRGRPNLIVSLLKLPTRQCYPYRVSATLPCILSIITSLTSSPSLLRLNSSPSHCPNSLRCSSNTSYLGLESLYNTSQATLDSNLQVSQSSARDLLPFLYFFLISFSVVLTHFCNPRTILFNLKTPPYISPLISSLTHPSTQSSLYPSLSPTSSSYAIHNGPDGDPFIDLNSGIAQYLVFGTIILLGDFNARTIVLQTPLHDQSENMFCTQEVEPELLGLHWMSKDTLGPIIAYGQHLL